MKKKYITKMVLINKPQPLRFAGTNAITILNTGTTNAQIDAFILVPGASFEDNGWPGEENHSLYNIDFPTGSGECLLFIKQYI